MKIVTLNLSVEDDFEPGNCYDCPLNVSYDSGYDDEPYCVLCRKYTDCPLTVLRPLAGYDESDEGWDEISD